jgi:pyruvate-formate lyase
LECIYPVVKELFENKFWLVERVQWWKSFVTQHGVKRLYYRKNRPLRAYQQERYFKHSLEKIDDSYAKKIKSLNETCQQALQWFRRGSILIICTTDTWITQ